ncbi:MAG TPA: glucoamylase family protein [Chloroflexota bacterium]|nr:glucoamylase family protein [Chloroflexota bacterium]
MRSLPQRQLLDSLQRETFGYFIHESNPANGLVKDKTAKTSPASIAAVGLALAAYPIGVETGLLHRDEATKRTLATLRFFQQSEQGTRPDATGCKGFYYHFLDMNTGRRVWSCELSTVDTAFLLAGMLAAAAYFDRDSGAEPEIRDLADELYRRADWDWARNEGPLLTHGWNPESGFLPYRWDGYNEALLLYTLGLGSPTHPLPADSYRCWTSTYAWKNVYGYELLDAGPLFIHQLSHVWIDFRGIQDALMRERGIDYFENSRRATYVHQQYCIQNPHGWADYGEHCWGITASDGPGPTVRRIDGVERTFYGYLARGAPDGPDDGSISPWAVVASLPFAPEIVLPTIECFEHLRLRVDNPYGFKATYNPTFTTTGKKGWISRYHFGLNQGPIVLMIANYQTGLLWELLRGCPYLVTGLRHAGFTGGWLDDASSAE